MAAGEKSLIFQNSFFMPLADSFWVKKCEKSEKKIKEIDRLLTSGKNKSKGGGEQYLYGCQAAGQFFAATAIFLKHFHRIRYESWVYSGLRCLVKLASLFPFMLN